MGKDVVVEWDQKPIPMILALRRPICPCDLFVELGNGLEDVVDHGRIICQDIAERKV